VGTRDYTPLDIGPWCTLSVDEYLAMLVEEPGVSYPEPRDTRPGTGRRSLRGLPFRIGTGTGEEARFLAPREGAADIVIPVGRGASEVLFAHAILGSDLWRGAPVGRTFADYAFRLAGGTEVVVPIRERFEVGNIPLPWGQYPFLAVPDREDVQEPRLSGRWERIGFRLTEVSAATPGSWFLWAWTDPDPDRLLEAIVIRPRLSGLVIGGITLGHLGEDPLRPRTRITVRLRAPYSGTTQAEPIMAGSPQPHPPMPEPPSVEVDRGQATYPQPLAELALDADPTGRPGWGATVPVRPEAWGLDVAALPSSTITVRHEGRRVELPWEPVSQGGVSARGGIRIEAIDPGRNWVRVTVVDEASGRPVPCRVAFQTPEGVAYAPHGHHAHVFSGLPDWNGDIGGDVRLGQVTYAYIDGACEGWLPRGPLVVDVARGFEVEPLRTRVTIAPGQTELRLALRRIADLAAEGWHSGDTHVHFLSPQGALREAAGEDLRVVNLLQTQWGHHFTNTEDFTGGPHVSASGEQVVWVSQENRQHILGHINLLGLREPVMPWATGGPGEAEIGGGLESTLSHWADRGRARGATVVIAHFPTPNAEAAALVATGRADAAEMFDQLDHEHGEYYRYLNAGYRLPLVAGTDKMDSSTPVGLYRTYARLEPDEPFSFAAWTAALRAGRTFISSGPLLRFSVAGDGPGATVSMPVGATLDVEGSATSIFPIHVLQLVERGRVVEEVTAAASGGARELRLTARVRVSGATWLALRCGGPDYRPVRHLDGRRRGIMAHSGPVYVAPGGHYDLRDAATEEYLVTLIRGGLEYVRRAAPRFPEASVTHGHGAADHLAWLEGPFHEAIAAIKARGEQGE
jgi:hypothetical protein